MLVEVTNVTDAPGKQGRQVDIYRKTLNPGDTVKIPAELITPQVRSLEKEGFIHIGQVPSWYTAYKMKHGKELTQEQLKERLTTKLTPKEVVPVGEVVVEEKETGRKRR